MKGADFRVMVSCRKMLKLAKFIEFVELVLQEIREKYKSTFTQKFLNTANKGGMLAIRAPFLLKILSEKLTQMLST